MGDQPACPEDKQAKCESLWLACIAGTSGYVVFVRRLVRVYFSRRVVGLCSQSVARYFRMKTQ